MVYSGLRGSLQTNKKGLDPDGRLINKAIADELVERLQAGSDGVIKAVTKSKKKMYNVYHCPYHLCRY